VGFLDAALDFEVAWSCERHLRAPAGQGVRG
jgi:hypothetical protein